MDPKNDHLPRRADAHGGKIDTQRNKMDAVGVGWAMRLLSTIIVFLTLAACDAGDAPSPREGHTGTVVEINDYSAGQGQVDACEACQVDTDCGAGQFCACPTEDADGLCLDIEPEHGGTLACEPACVFLDDTGEWLCELTQCWEQ